MGTRDPRIDFFRGLALLAIVTYHVLGNHLTGLTLGPYLECDAAETFVFLAGLVAGIVYGKTLVREGLPGCLRRSFRRCAVLYATHLVLVLACAMLVVTFPAHSEVDYRPFNVQPMIDQPLKALRHMLTLTYAPWLSDILRMYIVLLAAAPVMFWLYRRHRWPAIGLSLAVYAIPQIWPDITPRDFPSNLPWFWNPLGWQILFFSGAWIGMERSTGTFKLPRTGLLVGSAIVFIAATVVLKQMDWMRWGMSERSRMGVTRVAQLFCLAYLAWALLPPTLRWWRSSVAQTLMRCGRHSLPVFCLGVICSYIDSLILLDRHGGAWMQAPLVGTAVALSILLATVLDALDRRRSLARAPETALAAISQRTTVPNQVFSITNPSNLPVVETQASSARRPTRTVNTDSDALVEMRV